MLVVGVCVCVFASSVVVITAKRCSPIRYYTLLNDTPLLVHQHSPLYTRTYVGALMQSKVEIKSTKFKTRWILMVNSLCSGSASLFLLSILICLLLLPSLLCFQQFTIYRMFSNWMHAFAHSHWTRFLFQISPLASCMTRRRRRRRRWSWSGKHNTHSFRMNIWMRCINKPFSEVRKMCVHRVCRRMKKTHCFRVVHPSRLALNSNLFRVLHAILSLWFSNH